MTKKLLFLVFFLGVSYVFGQDLHSDSNAVSISNEVDGIDGWNAQAVLSTESVDVQAGNFSFRLVSTNDNGRLLEYNFNAVIGTDYTIRIWAKEGDTSNSPAFANWVGLNGFGTTPITGTNWTEYVFNVTATSTNPVIRVYTSPFTERFVAGNTVLIDAVSIIVDGSDTEAPSAVNSLVSSNTALTSTDLSWNASSDNVGVINYEVFQDGVSIADTGTATTLNVTSLTANTSYDFTVLAEDAAGNISLAGNVETVTTLSDTQAPSAITDLSSSNTTTTTTDLSWTASTDNIGVTNYEIFQDGVSIANTGTNTFLNVTGLTPETSYNFTIVAEDAAGNLSAVSNTENVTTNPSLDTEAPTSIADLSSSNTTSSSTSLTWSASTDNVSVTNYEVFQDGNSIANTGTTTSLNVTGLTPSTSYNFVVFAEDAAGNISAASNTESVTTLAGTGIVDYTSENANLLTVDWTAANLFADQSVGIGTTNTQGYRLAVAGNVIAEGVRVELQTNWPDFVFGKDYELPRLDEVKAFIAAFGHLPNVPSAKKVEQEGIDLGTMDAKLLQKIEELTLYLISQESEIQELKLENERMKEMLEKLQENIVDNKK